MTSQHSPLPTAVQPSAPNFSAANLDRIPLGVGSDGGPVCWNMTGPCAHLLVSGRTGSGKSAAMTELVLAVAARDWPVWVCDPKVIDFEGLRGWPNVQGPATSLEDMVAVILRAQEEMERRYARWETGGLPADLVPLVVILDGFEEFTELVVDHQALTTSDECRCSVVEATLESLIRKGRFARIHLVMGIERLTAASFSGEMRDNFGRLHLGPATPSEAMLLWGSTDIAESSATESAGRGITDADDGSPIEVQVYSSPIPSSSRSRGPSSSHPSPRTEDGDPASPAADAPVDEGGR